MKSELLLTADGSHTLRISGTDITYHSIHGAFTESMHVFIRTGLSFWIEKFQPTVLNIFEMGFGTGLNCLLTLNAANPRIKINYTTIERDPVSSDVIRDLNFAELLSLELNTGMLEKIHNAAWNEETMITPTFSLRKMKAELQSAILPDAHFDIIYYDAFAPSAQPELWTIDIFKKLSSALKNGGILVTYCSKGQVRRNLQQAGFNVEKIPGPPRKREIIRAIKT